MPAAALPALRDAWMALESRVAAPRFYQAWHWAMSLSESIAPDADRFGVVVVRRHGELVMAMPCCTVSMPGPLGGRQWRMKSWGFGSDILLAPDVSPASIAALLEQWSLGGGVFVASRILQDAAASSVGNAASWCHREPHGLRAVFCGEELARTPRQRSRKLAANLRNARNRLTRAGPLTFERVDEPGPAMEAALEAFVRIEASGWKGRQHTAIASSTDTTGFYRTLACRFSCLRRAAVWLLRVGDTPVAGAFGLRDSFGWNVLKLGFDEAFSRGSPGHVLIDELIAEAQQPGGWALDMLTAPDWLRVWSPRILPTTDCWLTDASWRGRMLLGAQRTRHVLRGVRARLLGHGRPPWN